MSIASLPITPCTVRRAILIFFAVVLLPLCSALFSTSCGGTLTPTEQASVAQDGIQLATCAASAHLCKVAGEDGGIAECYREYDACMSAHGFADASVDAQGDR